MSQENHGRLAIMSFKGGCDFGQLSLSVSGWLPRVVCLSGVNAAANWRRQHLITFLNCATQLLLGRTDGPFFRLLQFIIEDLMD
jgi:hypothetical protein